MYAGKDLSLNCDIEHKIVIRKVRDTRFYPKNAKKTLAFMQGMNLLVEKFLNNII